VGLLSLSCGEIQDCYKESRKRLEDLGIPIDEDSADFLDLEMQYQIIAHCVLEPDSLAPDRRLFPNVAQVRKELTPNEIDYLIECRQTEMQAEISAWRAKLSSPAMLLIASLVGLDETATAEDVIAAVGQLVEQ
jgi:hypothetical protein